MQIIILFKRIRQWKDHLIPPVIAVVYFLFPFNSADHSVFIRLISYIFALFFVSLFGYWMNDWFDRELDRKSGKPNFLEGTSVKFRVVGGIVILFLAFFSWYFTAPPLVATLFFCAEVVFFILYCIPGIRFKNHPLLGPLFDAHYTHILPVFFTWFLFDDKISSYWLISVYFLLLSKGLRNILLHQIDDRKGDAKMKLKTLPLVVGPYATIKIISWFLIPAEIVFITTLSIIPLSVCSTLAIFWLTFLTVYFFFFSGWLFFFINTRYFLFMFRYFLNDFYEYWLPILGIWTASITFQTKIFLSILHLLIFYKTITYFKKLSFKILTNLNILNIS